MREIRTGRKTRIWGEIAVALVFLAAANAAISRAAWRTDLRLVLEARSPSDDHIALCLDHVRPPRVAALRGGAIRHVTFELPPRSLESLELALGDWSSRIELLSVGVRGPFGFPRYRLSGPRLETLLVAPRSELVNGSGHGRWLTLDPRMAGTLEALHADKTSFRCVAALLALLLFGLLHSLRLSRRRLRPRWRVLANGGAVFALFLGFPLAAALFHIRIAPGLQEKRALAPPARLRLDDPIGYPRDFQAFFRDNFPLRSELVLSHNWLLINVFGASPNSQVLIGKDGWLIADGPGDFPGTTDYFRALDPFEPADLERWTTVLEERRRWLEARGIRYLFVIAPNTNTIYPEVMPRRIRRVGRVSRMDQLLEYLRAHSKIEAPDLRPALIAAKSEQRVYFKTDSHWNDYGAFIAAREILQAASAHLPVSPLPLSRFRAETALLPAGDLSLIVGLTQLGIRERAIRLIADPPLGYVRNQLKPRYIVTKRPGAPLGGLFFVGDSFYERLLPFLAEQASRSYFIENGYFVFFPEFIGPEKPDLVIEEIAERKLMMRVPRNPPGLGQGR